MPITWTACVDGQAVTYYLFNAHGDVVQLTDAAGEVTKSYEYDAFGVEENPSASDSNPFRYCGEYYDISSGTYYLRARYYDPTTGRFLSEDTYQGKATDTLSLNLYTYCKDNPIVFIDPNGHIGIYNGQIYMGDGDTQDDKQLLQLKIDYAKATTDSQRKRIAQEANVIRHRSSGYRVLSSSSLSTFYIPDLTNSITKILAQQESTFEDHSSDVPWFIDHVKTNSLVDVKNSNPEFLRPWYSYHVIINGEVMRADAPGNIMYGYLGTAACFDEETLLAGAGAYQIWEDSDRKIGTAITNIPKMFHNFGDNVGDGEEIRYGISWFWSAKYPGYSYPDPMPGPPPELG
jgi:RHS repeat-associated protein